MKAYIIRRKTTLYPFDKPASKLQLKDHTVGSRLESQLVANGYGVEYADSLDSLSLAAGNLIIQDNLLMSNNFLSHMIKAIPDHQGNYQCEVNLSRNPLLIEKDPAPEWHKIYCYYVGSPENFDPDTAQLMQLSAANVHIIDRGLPARMHELVEIRAYFCEFYAQPIDYWFDFQKAISLYTREYATNLISLAKKYLPDPWVHWATQQAWLMSRGNRIGKNCNIHPSAILEGCIVGDNVEIGPFSYLRSSIIGNDVVLRENTSIKMAYVGEKAFVMGSDIANCYIGNSSSIITPMLYNTVFGEDSFISGGSGFADFNIGSGHVTASVNGEEISSGMNYLGSCIGDRVFIGANMIFSPGRVIPNDSNLLDNGLIKNVPTEPGGNHVLSGKQFLQIPGNFTGAKKP